MLTFTEYAAERDRLDSVMTNAGKRLSSIGAGTGPLGLTPDAIKAKPAYQSARAEYQRAHAALRALNGQYVARYRKELQAERDARRMAKLAGLPC